MDSKTDDQVAREKEAVQKMVGAKSAMESALSRINTLEGAIKSMNSLLDDMSRKVGDGVGYLTYTASKTGSEALFASVKDQANRAAGIGRKVL